MKKLKHILVLSIAILSFIDISAQTPITVCPQSASFTGMTRGYYFTAPTNFTICGIYVEDDMSTAFQSAAIVKFTAGPPPAYNATTNAFITLWQNLNYVPNSMIPVPNVTINAGDIIGIYGSRTANSVNSYGPAQCVINIQGFPTTTFRSGMQFDLAAGPGMHDIWNENNGSIGRVTMYTGCCPQPLAISAVSGDTTVCEGDTITYTAPAQTGATGYNWTVPAGATILSGQNTTNVTVHWASGPGGQVCVDWTDTCTTSPQTCQNVVVAPTPTAILPANSIYCHGNMVPASAFASNPAGGTFTWTNSNTAIGLGASGSGNTPAFSANNTTGAPITGTITVIPTTGSCVGNPSTYTITIDPLITSSSNVEICQGDSILINGNYYSQAGSHIDTLSSINGCDSVVTYTVAVNIVSVATSNITICDGDSVLLYGDYYSTPGNYPFTFTSYKGCDSIINYVVAFSPLPVFTITGGDSIYLGQSVHLAIMPGVSGTTYSWTPPEGLSCVFCQNPVATPPASTWYYVTVTDAAGCSVLDSVYIDVDPTSNIYIPNIFSPNDDDNNDVYLVRGQGIELFNIAIFNRWGQKVFESEDIEKGWDGTINDKPANQGVFVYKINATMYDGGHIKQTGNITLVR